MNPRYNGPEDEEEEDDTAGVLYFLLGLAVAGLLAYFVVDGLYHFLGDSSPVGDINPAELLPDLPGKQALVELCDSTVQAEEQSAILKPEDYPF